MTDLIVQELQSRPLGQQVGYLVASTHELHTKIDDMKDVQNTLCGRVGAVEKQISTARTVVQTVKFLGASILLVLTLRFGSIPSSWRGYFG